MRKISKFIEKAVVFLTILGLAGQLLPTTGLIKIAMAEEQLGLMCSRAVDVVLIMDTSGSMADGASESSCWFEELKWLGDEVTGSFQRVSDTSYGVSQEWCSAEERNVPECQSAIYTPANLSKQEHAKIAAGSFLNSLGANDQSAVVSFNNIANLVKELSSDHLLSQTIINGLTTQGATNIGSAIAKAIIELGSVRAQSDSNKVIVLLTDGKANKPNGDGTDENADDLAYALAKAQEATDFGYKIFTVGLGDNGDINIQMLQDIANLTGANYHHAPNGYDLSDIYQQIAYEVCQIEPEPPAEEPDDNATSTDDGNTTSTDDGSATSTDNGDNATSTDNGNATSTDDGDDNASSTDETATSTQPTSDNTTSTDLATTTDSGGNQSEYYVNNSGPVVPGYGQGVFVPLAIFDERIDSFSQSSISLSWRTNRMADSRVVFGPSSIGQLSTEEFYGYPSVSQTSDNPDYVLDHYLTINDLTPGFTYYLRPIGQNPDIGKAVAEKELSIALGASIAPVGDEATLGADFSTSSLSNSQSNGQCSYLLDSFLKFGQENPSDQVEKLQRFLNDFEGQSLAITGLFDQSTLEAVEAFQAKYQEDILTPWGETEPTGYVYITTRKKINELYCQQEIILTHQELAEIEAYHQLIENISQGPLQEVATSTNPLIGKIDLGAIGQPDLPGLSPLSWQDILKASLAQLYQLTK